MVVRSTCPGDHSCRERRRPSPVDLDRISISQSVQDLFKDAVIQLIERRRLPCNISSINDIMRQKDKCVVVS